MSAPRGDGRPAVLVTGGSRGIGRATAALAARTGWNVAVSYVSDEVAAAGVVERVRAAGGEGIALRCDVRREDEVVAAFEAAEAALGPIGAVVVNAGIVAPAMTLAEMDAERLRMVIETNVVGALLTAREAMRRLPRAPGPDRSIVIVSSAAARIGSPFLFVDYAASKGALDTLTLGLAREGARDGIRVNAVRPGLIDTEIHAAAGRPDRAHALAGEVPMGRPGSAEEVAEAIVWLMGQGASYVAGAVIDVAGGR